MKTLLEEYQELHKAVREFSETLIEESPPLRWINLRLNRIGLGIMGVLSRPQNQRKNS